MPDVPHTLQAAHRHLLAALKAGIGECHQNSRLADPLRTCRSIESFAEELCQTSAWKKELFRRAGLVSQLTAEGTPYHQAKSAAIHGFPASVFGGRRRRSVFPGYEKSAGRIWSWSMDSECKWIRDNESKLVSERLKWLKSLKLLKLEICRSLTEWDDNCRQIIKEAERVQADGCCMIVGVTEGARLGERNQIRLMFEDRDLDEEWLKEVRAAAKSLMDFARAAPRPGATPEAPPDPTKKRTRSTKKDVVLKTHAAILHKIQHPDATEEQCAAAANIPRTTLTQQSVWTEWVPMIEQASVTGTISKLQAKWDRRLGELVAIEPDESE